MQITLELSILTYASLLAIENNMYDELCLLDNEIKSLANRLLENSLDHARTVQELTRVVARKENLKHELDVLVTYMKEIVPNA